MYTPFPPHFPTVYPELNAVLERLVVQVRAILDSAFVAAYLQGSFAVGDFDIHSDVDFMIVMKDDLREGSAQVDALQKMHGDLFDLGPDWARHLEGSYFPQELLNAPEAVGKEPLWYLDNGSRSLIRSTHCNTWVVRRVVSEQGITLAGPAPQTFLTPVSASVLCTEVRQTMGDWGENLLADPTAMDNRWYQPFAVLSYCRMLETLATGTVRSKREAVHWAEENLDERWAKLARQAWEERPDPSRKFYLPADPAALDETVAFLCYALTEAERREWNLSR